MSATITIKIQVNDKRQAFGDSVTRTFPSDHAESTAVDYYEQLITRLWDGVPPDVHQERA